MNSIKDWSKGSRLRFSLAALQFGLGTIYCYITLTLSDYSGKMSTPFQLVVLVVRLCRYNHWASRASSIALLDTKLALEALFSAMYDRSLLLEFGLSQ